MLGAALVGELHHRDVIDPHPLAQTRDDNVLATADTQPLITPTLRTVRGHQSRPQRVTRVRRDHTEPTAIATTADAPTTTTAITT